MGWTGGLAEVRASIAYGRPARCGNYVSDVERLANGGIGDTEVVRWAELLEYEAGLRVARRVDHELPAILDGPGVDVARGVLLMLALRDERWDLEPFTFTRLFTGAYCGLSEYSARAGLREVHRRGFLVRVGMQGRAFLYRLADAEAVDPW